MFHIDFSSASLADAFRMSDKLHSFRAPVLLALASLALQAAVCFAITRISGMSVTVPIQVSKTGYGLLASAACQ